MTEPKPKKKPTSELSAFARALDRAVNEGREMKAPPGSEMPGAPPVPPTEDEKREAAVRREIEQLQTQIASEKREDRLREWRARLAELKKQRTAKGKLASFKATPDRKLVVKQRDEDEDERDDDDDEQEQTTTRKATTSGPKSSVSTKLAKQIATMRGPVRIH